MIAPKKEPSKYSSILDLSLKDKLNLKHALYEFWKWKVFDGIFISPSISLKSIQCIYDNLLFTGIQIRGPSFQHLFVSPLDRTLINTFSFFCYCVLLFIKKPQLLNFFYIKLFRWEYRFVFSSFACVSSQWTLSPEAQ